MEPRENENKCIPDIEHIWQQGHFSTLPQAQISEASTAENKTKLISFNNTMLIVPCS